MASSGKRSGEAEKGAEARALQRWYARARRELPWRRTRDPYRVLVSEIMLQQTTVATVRRAYPRFLERFPTLEALAAADEEEVLAAWSGLGYYQRARNLQRAARQIREGGWPRNAEGLRRLPGIGPYTAAAVASIAFGEAVPVLDANAIRVVARWSGIAGDPRRAATRRRLAERARRLLDPHDPGGSNQALMDLGSLVCRPRDPHCARCPLASGCRARGSGRPDAFPAKPPKPRVVEERYAVLVVRDGQGRFLLTKREGRGPLRGLWGFPTVGPLGERERAAGRLLGRVRHGIMNRRLLLEVVVPSRAPRGLEGRYLGVEEIRRLPRSSIVDKVLALALETAR
jgi:A/G-specific adenine glycosylase